MAAIVVATLMVTWAPAVSAAGGLSRTYSVPRTIDSTGATDVSAVLNSWLASVPSGTSLVPVTVKFPSNARYWVEEPIWIEHKQMLNIVGNGATLFEKNPCTAGTEACGSTFMQTDRALLNLVFDNSISATGLSLVGANQNPGHYDAAYEGQCGFCVRGSRNVTITGNRVTDMYGDGVYVDYWGPYDTCSINYSYLWTPPVPCTATEAMQQPTNISVSNNTFTGLGRHGLAVITGQQISFISNTLTNTGYLGVDLEPDDTTGGTQWIDHITVDGNSFGATHPAGLILSASAAGNFVTVRNNTAAEAFGVWMTGPSASTPIHDWMVSGNSDSTQTGWGPDVMAVVNAYNVTIDANTQPFLLLPTSYGETNFVVLSCTQAGTVHITNNVISNASSVWTQGWPSLNQVSPCAGNPAYDAPLLSGNQT